MQHQKFIHVSVSEGNPACELFPYNSILPQLINLEIKYYIIYKGLPKATNIVYVTKGNPHKNVL